MQTPIVFGLKLNGQLWKEYSWVSKTGKIPENFFDNLSANSDFDMGEYEQTETYQRTMDAEEAESYEHLEWYGHE